MDLGLYWTVSIDVTNLLLGSGFALFLALLAWGDQIRKPRVEVTTLEESFRKEYNLSKKVTNPLIRKSYESMKGSSGYSFLQQTKSVIGLLENGNLKGENIKLLDKLRDLHAMRQKLEAKYRHRYFLSVCLCVLFFVFGVASVFTSGLVIDVPSFYVPLNYLYLTIVLVMITVIILNLFTTYHSEESFIQEIGKVDDQIEADIDGR